MLPNAEQELWRYSRIGELNLSSYRSGALQTTVAGATVTHKSLIAHGNVSAEAADVFEQRCSDKLRGQIYQFAGSTSPEPFRSAMHSLGYTHY